MKRIVVALLVLGAATTAGGQEPTLAQAIDKAADYVASYRARVSGAVLEELVMLIELAGPRMRVPVRLASDLVLVDTGSGLIALRDPYSIDTVALRKREPRIASELAEPTLAGWGRAQAYSREHAYHFRADVVWWGSDPTSVFRFIERGNHGLLNYKLDGRKRINGVQTMAIRFQEIKEHDKKYLLGTPGNAHSSGRLWIDPATGAIHQTELWVESTTETVRCQITYTLDKSLGLMLPQQGHQSYDLREAGSGMLAGGTSSVGRRLSLESTVTYSNARYSKIDLSKIVR
jgi:hypothetical protein